jgi:hypothetical protein
MDMPQLAQKQNQIPLSEERELKTHLPDSSGFVADLTCREKPVESIIGKDDPESYSGHGYGRWPNPSVGTDSGSVVPLLSCQFKRAHVQPCRVAPHVFAAQLVGVIAHGLPTRSIAQ